MVEGILQPQFQFRGYRHNATYIYKTLGELLVQVSGNQSVDKQNNISRSCLDIFVCHQETSITTLARQQCKQLQSTALQDLQTYSLFSLLQSLLKSLFSTIISFLFYSLDSNYSLFSLLQSLFSSPLSPLVRQACKECHLMTSPQVSYSRNDNFTDSTK